jgi:NADP-dependent 3-hydroxy acid dehydrogenase YdfG
MQPPAPSDPLAEGTPLEAEDVAAAVRFMIEQPERANIARLAIFSTTDAY